jgi:hypothetical protein
MKIVIAALLLGASLTVHATAHADNVPSVDQVVAIMAKLTDPGIPAANKGDVVTPGFTPEEAGMVDDHLDRMAAHYLPLNFVVTDIEPAPDNLAGAMLGATGPIPFYMHPYPRPIVLAQQGGHWLITHESAMNMLDVFCHYAMRQKGSTGDAQCGPRISTVG